MKAMLRHLSLDPPWAGFVAGLPVVVRTGCAVAGAAGRLGQTAQPGAHHAGGSPQAKRPGTHPRGKRPDTNRQDATHPAHGGSRLRSASIAHLRNRSLSRCLSVSRSVTSQLLGFSPGDHCVGEPNHLAGVESVVLIVSGRGFVSVVDGVGR